MRCRHNRCIFKMMSCLVPICVVKLTKFFQDENRTDFYFLYLMYTNSCRKKISKLFFEVSGVVTKSNVKRYYVQKTRHSSRFMTFKSCINIHPIHICFQIHEQFTNSCISTCYRVCSAKHNIG